MSKILLLLVLVSFKALALDAVVTVLETPMLKSPSYDAQVVQYLRKGDVIKIHPSVANDSRYDEYAPAPEKLKKLREEMKKSPEYNDDALFSGEEKNTYYLEDEFIPTLDRQGHKVYVISSHLYVYFNDSREFGQVVPKKDPTDYRLEEPLPRKYPLFSPSGYRGQFILGLQQPSFESYSYQNEVKRKGYSSPVAFDLTFLRIAPGNYNDRLFLGGTLSFKTFENTYSFIDRRFSQERYIKFGVGPTISYDAFKGEKDRLNLSANFIFNFFDRAYINQSLDERQDNRIYAAYSFAPKLNLQYHRKGILPDLDFVLGTALEMGLSSSYRAQNGGKEASWWNHLGNDRFSTRTTFSLGGYLGFQSAY